DAQEYHVFSERNAPRWLRPLRSAPVRSSCRSVPDRAGWPRPPRALDLEQASPFPQSAHQRAMSRIAWLKRYGSDELLASSIASWTRGVSTTLIEAKSISTILFVG